MEGIAIASEFLTVRTAVMPREKPTYKTSDREFLPDFGCSYRAGVLAQVKLSFTSKNL